jgi:DNA-directed RNA polymerase subunit RPC12/RpoP
MNLLFLGLLLGLVAGTAVTGFWFMHARASVEEASFHFHCSGCQRRFRYQARQQGKSVRCPQCGRMLKVPSVAGALPDELAAHSRRSTWQTWARLAQ